jgi:hypothetical protein
MPNIPVPRPGIYRRWTTTLWGGVIAFSIVAMCGFLLPETEPHQETFICFAPDCQEYALLQHKIDRGFSHYDLEDLQEVRELEQRMGVVPNKSSLPVRNILFSVGTTACILLLLVIYLQKLFRWVLFGKK